MTAALTVEFDATLAKLYPPKPGEVKQVVIVPVPEGVESTIMADWGREQKFIGPYAAIYRDGKVAYGSALDEFTESHDPNNKRENGYIKTEPILAYQYSGPPATVITRLANGHIETDNTVEDGKWMVQWKRGEQGVMDDAKFRSLYIVD
jgi:hypothetical protein